MAMLRSSLDGSVGFNVEQAELGFPDGVSMTEVENAWIETVMRTDVLRSGFLLHDGEPRGIVALETSDPLRVESGTPSSWEKWFSDDRSAPFPLGGGQPWRAVMWPEARKLVWTFHHALLDGRSIATILRAFQARLTGLEDPGNLELAVFPIPNSAEIEMALEFHRAAFAEVEPCEPEFPFDSGGPPACVQCTLGAETAARLESVAERMEVTAPTLLTWSWGQVVAAAAGVEAVAIGQVRSGPPTPNRAGFSMNTVPLVIERYSKGPLKTVLQEFRQLLLSLRDVENVSPQDLTSGIFNEVGGPWPGGGLMIQRGDLAHQMGLTDAITSIRLHEKSGENLLASAWVHPDMLMEVEVDGSQFGKEAAQTMLDHWASIVRNLANDSLEESQELCSFPTEAKNKLSMLEFGGEPGPLQHLARAWDESSRSFETACAVWTPDGSWTYGELGARVEHLAALLLEADVQPGQTVASILRNRKNLSLVMLALARIGAINVPLDPALPEIRLKGIIDDSSPSLILCDKQEDASATSLPSIVIDGESVGRVCAEKLPCDPGSTLSILYTSGSTGEPKGVMMVHGGVTNEAREIARHAGLHRGDRLLQFASPGFDASLEEMLATLLSGATLVPRPENLVADLDEFQSFIKREGITVLDLSTAHWAAWCAWMISSNERVPEGLRTVIIGGERAAKASLDHWFESGGREHLLLNTYGPTEASIVATVEPIDGHWDEPGDPAIGRPLPGVFARVGDALGRALPAGSAGELWLGGTCVGEGYLNRPDLTEDSFRFMDGLRWYRTGDRVAWDTRGHLRFLGRQDDQLKIRGNRVEPNEVIRVIESFPCISSAHAGPAPGGDGAVVLACWVRWNEAPSKEWPAELALHTAKQLPLASIPTRWAEVEEFRLTERGKLDRKRLPEPSLTASRKASSGPPETPTEIRLAKIWTKLLRVGTIARDESFFELGGHSLAALQLFAGIAKEWQLRIPMAILIQAPTLRLLGIAIDHDDPSHRRQENSGSIIVPVREEGGLLPLFCIHGGDGGVLFYRGLADSFPPGRPILAVESPALAADARHGVRPVEETAASYIEALREKQASGPYHLVGYSYGGLLAYEMARQLQATGEKVAFVGLLDTLNPAANPRAYSMLERVGIFWNSQSHVSLPSRIGTLFKRACEGVQTNCRVKREKHLARTSSHSDSHSDLRMLQVREDHWESTVLYDPLPFEGQVTLFRSTVPDDKFDLPADNGWGSIAESMDIVEVDGEHLEIFSPNHVANLAEKVACRVLPQ